MPRSTRVRPDLIPQVKSALKRNGFLRQQDLVDEVGLASSTVRNFLNGKAVDYATFAELCQRLNLEWRDFADSGEITELHRESDEAVSEEALAKPQRESVESDAGSIEDRIFKATNQLNPERPVFSRISGIQALGEIAKDSPRYHWQIMEVLAAFVRTNAPRKEEGEEERSLKLHEDIQAALTVIGGRDLQKNLLNHCLNLSYTNIKMADLTEAKLQGINFFGANLQDAKLFKANLERANLRQAKLQDAVLGIANLREAILFRANLERAFLCQAKLPDTDLTEANLERTNFGGANLYRAILFRANLERANLRGAILQEAVFSEAKLQGADFGNANLQYAKLLEADLQGANLNGVNVQGADFRRAKNLTSEQIKLARGDSKTILSENIERPAHWM